MMAGREVILKLISKAKFKELSESKLLKALNAQRPLGGQDEIALGAVAGRKRPFAETIAADIDYIVSRASTAGASAAPSSASGATAVAAAGAVASAGTGTFQAAPSPCAAAVLPYDCRFHLYDLLGMKLVERINRSTVGSSTGARSGHYNGGLENSDCADNILRIVKSK
jgi:hypothetical protein